jgi:hypothetical protein
LHDSTIQPYLGLKWALEAIQTKSAAGRPILDDLTRLVARVDQELLSMRRYVSSLRDPTESRAIEGASVELPLMLFQAKPSLRFMIRPSRATLRRLLATLAAWMPRYFRRRR